MLLASTGLQSSNVVQSGRQSADKGPAVVTAGIATIEPFADNFVDDNDSNNLSGDIIQRDLVFAAPLATAATANILKRSEVVSYTVAEGDTLFGVALKFNLHPETILWSNFDALNDNPNLLRIGQTLLVPPADGVIVEVQTGDSIVGLARQYEVRPEVIVAEAWNGLRDMNEPLAIGRLVYMPGGLSESVVWQLPEPVQVGMTQVQTALGTLTAKVYRVGSCGNVAIPALGSGALTFPTGSSRVSGYNFRGTHGGIDFGATLGAPIFAADGGTVVFAGDSLNAAGNFVGYGRYVVIDHGNGLQTLYAHNSTLNVSCGQQVVKGEVIALAGSTGKSTGPHSHFEVRQSGAYVNPWSLLQ
jgi:murein DD-endopeptidase MepM/ murein hydrolase activator NlpD